MIGLRLWRHTQSTQCGQTLPHQNGQTNPGEILKDIPGGAFGEMFAVQIAVNVAAAV